MAELREHQDMAMASELKPTAPNFDLGVAWYPEWEPEGAWRKDLDAMEQAGITSVRIAEFSWETFEPADEQWSFELYDDVVAELERRRVHFIFGVDTVRPPNWVFAKFPDIHLVDDTGVPAPGMWPRHCFNHPSFEELSRRYIEKVVPRYKGSPMLVAYQLDNETAYHAHGHGHLGGRSFCYCRHCEAGFSRWLDQRYDGPRRPSLPRPFPRPYHMGELAWVEWRLFHEDTNVRRVRFAAEEVHRHDTLHPVTTNIMVGADFRAESGTLAHDVFGLSRAIDTMGMDFYPDMRHDADDFDTFVYSLSDQLGYPNGFHCLETQATTFAVPGGKWEGQERGFKDFGPHEKVIPQFWRAVAWGALDLYYWVWRLQADNVWSLACPDGSLREAATITAQLSSDIRRVWPLVRQARRPPARVAVVFTKESEHLALHHGLTGVNGKAVANAFAAARRYFDVVDVLSLSGGARVDLTGYEIVIAPFLYVVPEVAATTLHDYVRQGGTLVWGARGGSHGEPPGGWREVPVASDIRLPVETVPACGLDEVLGFRRTRTGLPDASPLHVRLDRSGPDLELDPGLFCDIIEPYAEAEVLTSSDMGEPAVVRYRFGRGTTWSVLVDAFAELTPGLVGLLGHIVNSAAGTFGVSSTEDHKADTVMELPNRDWVRRRLPDAELNFLINSTSTPWLAQIACGSSDSAQDLLAGTELTADSSGIVSVQVPPWGATLLTIQSPHHAHQP